MNDIKANLRKSGSDHIDIRWPVVIGWLVTALIWSSFQCPVESWAAYDLPNDDSGCPANCRQIPWKAGSDQWNEGVLPNNASLICTGLTEGDGLTDNSARINSCIAKADTSTAVYIPAGIYYVNGRINLKDNVVLRGAGSSSPWLPSQASGATTLKLGPNGFIYGGEGSRGPEWAITGGYTKGSQTLIMEDGHGLAVNDWIAVYEDADPEIPTTPIGDIGTCTWCGQNNGNHFIQQFVQVTKVDGNTITISRPLYYTHKSTLNPMARKISWGISYAGVENIKLNGWSGARSAPFIQFNGALFCWVKNVETYNAPSDAAKASHVYLAWSHGCEIRDSYFHYGRNNGSDRNYGISFFFWNSDHKVENNILRHHRHSIAFEGGGAGCVVLYNYIDDNYTDDTTYLGSARFNHGAHPYMNLFEGNIISHITADSYWGSSSHFVVFRNWLMGDETGTGVPRHPPKWGYNPIDVWYNQNYYAFVGNVLGGKKPANVNWNSYSLRNTNCSGNSIYSYGCDSNGNYSGKANASSINHGNYDFKSKGVAYWEGGTDHTLRVSMYYSSKPSFFPPGISWPPFGPDVTPVTGTIPAKERYMGSITPIPPPKNVKIKR